MPRPKTKTILALNAGNVLEWYDFVVFAYLAPYLSDEFFPSSDPIAGLIQTYGVFAAGYFARPIGGALYGFIGDRFGRSRALKISIIMMMVPTTLIAALPTHAEIGAAAAGLLIACRLLQGLAVGGEQGGANCYLVEISPPGRKGLFGSLAYTGTVFGILLGSLIVLVAKSSFTSDQMHEWAWRLPFLGGIAIAVIGILVRRHLHETPDFLAAKERGELTKHPLIHLVTEAPANALRMVCMLIYGTVSFYAVFVWLPTYATHFGNGTELDPQLINTLALVVLLVFLPLGGHMADRFGYKRVIAVTAIIAGLLSIPIFLAAINGWDTLLIALLVLFAINLAMPNGASPIALTDMMPPHLRYTGGAVAMNLSVALFGGTAPIVITWLIATTGSDLAPAWYLIAVSVVSFLVALTIRPTAFSVVRRTGLDAKPD
ncbi:MAG: MFS transporter [Pseudomonadota bacterium]